MTQSINKKVQIFDFIKKGADFEKLLRFYECHSEAKATASVALVVGVADGRT